MNEIFLIEYIKSREAGELTPAFILLINQLIKSIWHSYPLFDDELYSQEIYREFQIHTMRIIQRNWNKMNLEKSTNVYAFFSTSIRGSFASFMTYMKKSYS